MEAWKTGRLEYWNDGIMEGWGKIEDTLRESDSFDSFFSEFHPLFQYSNIPSFQSLGVQDVG
jgi:hypothetical protein